MMSTQITDIMIEQHKIIQNDKSERNTTQQHKNDICKQTSIKIIKHHTILTKQQLIKVRITILNSNIIKWTRHNIRTKQKLQAKVPTYRQHTKT